MYFETERTWPFKVIKGERSLILVPILIIFFGSVGRRPRDNDEISVAIRIHEDCDTDPRILKDSLFTVERPRIKHENSRMRFGYPSAFWCRVVITTIVGNQLRGGMKSLLRAAHTQHYHPVLP